MKRSATQKAAALAGSTAAIAAASPSADAAVTLANGIPSPTIGFGLQISFSWDVDGVNCTDFALSAFQSYGYFQSRGLNGRGVINDRNTLTDNAYNLPLGFNVGPTLSGDYFWGPGQERRTMTSLGGVGLGFDGGIWNSDQNYVGFRFDSGGNTHYGWAQLNLASQQIVAAAYNDTPDAPIMVGQVPEPSNLALLGLGIVGLSMMRRRKSA